MTFRDDLAPSDTFVHRHIGPAADDVAGMLETVGVATLDALIDDAIPSDIRTSTPLVIGPGGGERETLAELRQLAEQNQVFRSYIGQGYHGCITPPVILRNVLENPGWYTQYTPYQAEIAQGRLEALLNFQTMVADLTGLPLANASLLDEATAAAEAMTMCHAIAKGDRKTFYVAGDCHPQTIAVVRTRARPLGHRVQVGPPLAAADADAAAALDDDVFGVLVQVPTTDGHIPDPAALRRLIDRAHEAGALVVCAVDLLALTLIVPPGELGADIAVGSSQRFGVPMGYGGPHAAFLATREDHKRSVPGRLIGVSRDAAERPAFRLSLQTREQHIRRDRATSNICTAQVLLANIASMYAVYHGPDGLRRIARRVRGWTHVLAVGLTRLGLSARGGLAAGARFDTVRVDLDAAARDAVIAAARNRRINLRVYSDGLGVALDETVGEADVRDLLWAFAHAAPGALSSDGELLFAVSDVVDAVADAGDTSYPAGLARETEFLTHETFHRYHAEHEMLRYLARLQSRDLSLTTSMIPLGSCTMKLNATAEMIPVTWPEFGGLHPYAPDDQATGYHAMIQQLERQLAHMTGFAAVSMQPNSGAQGEYAGMLAIRGYHESRGEGSRDVCLIPTSAHGTNPATAVMAGYRVVAVPCDDHGSIDVEALRRIADERAGALAALMITYPSTHGVFEARIREICQIVHDRGGQVYLDGANMNAQIGLCRPGDYGADVCHLNLHKTFCIPHGGGGPGMGPIACAEHLAPFLPADPLAPTDGGAGAGAVGPVAAARFGSPSILPISWMYIALMGGDGLTHASKVAILNANYMAARLREHYDVLYTGRTGRVAHEFIVDCRPFKKTAGIQVDDIAKRLMDFGFHAPTMSWPVPGTLMIEPTESESRAELDRFCDAMIAIRDEIRAIETGAMSREDNPLVNAPHTAEAIAAADWDHPYGREQAAYPAPHLRVHKFWPPVARIDNVWGDRNLVCTCPPLDAYVE